MQNSISFIAGELSTEIDVTLSFIIENQNQKFPYLLGQWLQGFGQRDPCWSSGTSCRRQTWAGIIKLFP